MPRLQPQTQFDESMKSLDIDGMALTVESDLKIYKLNTRNLSQDVSSSLTSILGVASMPDVNKYQSTDNIEIACVAPGEWLVFGAEADLQSKYENLASSLSGSTALMTDISDGRVSFLLSGEGITDALSSLVQIDFDQTVFAAGTSTRTLLGETGAFVQRQSAGSEFRVIVDQSFALYAWRMLKDAMTNISF